MIYLAGPIQSDPDYFVKFAAAAAKLREQGPVFNPAATNQEGRPIAKIMAYLIPQLCECDTIAMMPGWISSGGAMIEWLLARYLKLKVIYL